EVAVPTAQERPARVTILPPSRPAGRRCVACARAAQEQATGQREEAQAALQALPMAALPAIASVRQSRLPTAPAARAAARARRAPPARPLPPARPWPAAPVAAARWSLRPAGPPAAACRLTPVDGGKPPLAARRQRARCSARPPRRSAPR